MYSQTCLKRSPLERKIGLSRQEFNSNEIFCQGQKKCDRLMQVTAWVVLMVLYMKKIVFSTSKIIYKFGQKTSRLSKSQLISCYPKCIF